MTHADLKKLVLSRPGAKAEYDALESEFKAMTMKLDFTQLDQTFDADDYEYLNLHASVVLSAIERLVRDGATPEQIRNHCGRRIGAERQAFVLRCEGAARHLRSQQVNA